MTALFHAIAHYPTRTAGSFVWTSKSPLVIDEMPMTTGLIPVDVDGLEPPTPAL